jgi:hypothetical protein
VLELSFEYKPLTQTNKFKIFCKTGLLPFSDRMAGCTPATPSPPAVQEDTWLHTRPRGEPSPSNLQRPKRVRNAEFQAPPPLSLTGKAPAPERQAGNHLSSRAEDMIRRAAVKAEVIESLGSTLDNWVTSFKTDDKLEQHSEACAVVKSVLQYLDRTFLGINQGNTVGSNDLPQVMPPTGASKGTETTWSAVARRGLSAQAGTRLPTSKQSLPTKSSGSKEEREDLRILVTTDFDESGVSSGPPRQDAFRIRHQICKEFGLAYEKVPDVKVTRRGYAIRVSDQAVRSTLMTEQGKREIGRICGGVKVALPETWYTYVVPAVPNGWMGLGESGTMLNAVDLVWEEAATQAKREPVACNPSKAGPDPITGRCTWIISFREPVERFRLFCSSGLAYMRPRKARLELHTTGCQGYCTGRRCYRMDRCGRCGDRKDGHAPGPCDKQAQCANCRGPFEAGHEGCPAAPKRKNGRWVFPTRSEMKAIKRIGLQAFEEARKAAASSSADTPSQPGANTAPSRKRGLDESGTMGDTARAPTGANHEPPHANQTEQSSPVTASGDTISSRPRRTASKQISTYNVQQLTRDQWNKGDRGPPSNMEIDLE